MTDALSAPSSGVPDEVTQRVCPTSGSIFVCACEGEWVEIEGGRYYDDTCAGENDPACVVTYVRKMKSEREAVVVAEVVAAFDERRMPINDDRLFAALRQLSAIHATNREADRRAS